MTEPDDATRRLLGIPEPENKEMEQRAVVQLINAAGKVVRQEIIPTSTVAFFEKSFATLAAGRDDCAAGYKVRVVDDARSVA